MLRITGVPSQEILAKVESHLSLQNFLAAYAALGSIDHQVHSGLLADLLRLNDDYGLPCRKERYVRYAMRYQRGQVPLWKLVELGSFLPSAVINVAMDEMAIYANGFDIAGHIAFADAGRYCDDILTRWVKKWKEEANAV